MKPIVSASIEQYATAHTTPHSTLLEELKAYTLAHCDKPQMLVGPVEGAMLKLLVKLTRARRILEIGLYTGYSALTMAEALPEDGELISCEIDADTAKIAQSYFDRSPHGHKITIRVGPAIDTVRMLEAAVVFDMVFIDADKENYCAYYDAALSLLRSGGVLVADNTLWSGNVLDPDQGTDHAVVAFNDLVQSDPRVENVLLTVRDGVMLVRKN
ncbi:MAG: O-methyltransferase [Acidiferrobacterales bacterium]